MERPDLPVNVSQEPTMTSSDQPANGGSLLNGLLRDLLALTEAPVPDDLVEADLDVVLDEIEDKVRSRRLDASYHEVFVAAARVGSREIDAMPFTMVTVTGLNRAGDPEPLTYMSGYADAPHLVVRAFWDLFLRGVEDISRVVGPPHIGLDDVSEAVYPDAEWLRLPPDSTPAWLQLGGDERD